MKTATLMRTLAKARFVVTFDDEGIVDTITRNGKLISSAHVDAQVIINNADSIRAGIAPRGFVWARPGQQEN